MNLQLYLGLSTLIGMLQCAEGLHLLKRKGVLQTYSMVFSLLELAWIFPSYWVWRQADASLPWWLPVSYIAYVLAFMAGGVVLVIQQRGQPAPLPQSLVLCGSVFGAYFAGVSAWCLLA